MLDKIIENKKKEIEIHQSQTNLTALKNTPFFNRSPFSLKTNLLNSKTGIIAEFKRQSPSKGVLHANADLLTIVKGYELAQASAVSILTDSFFAGHIDDVINARPQLQIPILRKDFMIDEYQFYQAKSIGADVVLLLANVLSKEDIKKFTNLAHNLNLEVLLELRDESEIEKIYSEVDVIGVNNRNLKNFSVNLSQSVLFEQLLPKDKIKISESGICTADDILKLQAINYKGFLIGEHFMKTTQPEKTCANLINDILTKTKP